MKLLFTICRLLYPPNTGGKIRTSKLFEKLSQDHDITILCFRDESETDAQVEEMLRCCNRIETVPWKAAQKNTFAFYVDVVKSLFSSDAYTIQKYTRTLYRDRFEEIIQEQPFDLVICDFLQPSRNVVNSSFHPKIIFQHNVEAVIRERQFRQVSNPFAKAFLYFDWRRMFAYEKIAINTFDHTIAVSDADAKTFERDYGAKNVSVIPTGVDVDYFESLGSEREGVNIVFTGSMDWLPNDDGMRWFLEEILPDIRKTRPEVNVWVVGRNPLPDMIDLCNSIPNCHITGTVDDVRPYIDFADLFIVPLRIGSGTRMKIFEAMAMNKAVVSTTIGAEGLPVSDGENIVLADSPRDFADRVIGLLTDEGARSRIASSGRELVRCNFTWNRVAEEFATICEQVVASQKKEGI